ncbi:hypothetical protein FQA39_LY02485 [Lamprigera yunnana]|nr:hypothetical protein FQA39_LY02485 [Lamprigera yunnana]
MYFPFMISVLLVILFLALIRRYLFWSRNGVSQYNILYIWFQQVKDVLTQRPFTAAMEKLYNDFYNERYVGTYQWCVPRLCIKDRELIKQILVKDFDHFTDHNHFIPVDNDHVWGKSLLMLRGSKWKRLRNVASPAFTGYKIKIMFDSMLLCAQQFLNYLDDHEENLLQLEMKEVVGHLTSDIFFASHFGIVCNSLKEPDNECYLMGQRGLDFDGFWIKIRFFLITIIPKIAKIFSLTVLDANVIQFFRKLVRNNIMHREKNKIVRPDLINLIMDLNSENKVVSEDEAVAFAITFFGGGFDTVSTLLSFVLYELSLNPQVQRRLQDEIDAFTTMGITYDCLQNMKYLDMVISETLRKWPSGFFLERRCTKPYTIQPVNENETTVHLKEDDQIWIPLFALHRDPQWFDEPSVFKPERFDNEDIIKSYSYLPFGAGPRHCIGNRYALLVTKVVTYIFLSKYTVKPIKQTAIPMRLCRSYLQLISKNKF